MIKILTFVLLISGLTNFSFASEKDHPPGCLTGADNSKVALVALDNYTSTNGTNAQLEELKKDIKANKQTYIDVESLMAMGVSEEGAVEIVGSIQTEEDSF